MNVEGQGEGADTVVPAGQRAPVPIQNATPVERPETADIPVGLSKEDVEMSDDSDIVEIPPHPIALMPQGPQQVQGADYGLIPDEEELLAPPHQWILYLSSQRAGKEHAPSLRPARFRAKLSLVLWYLKRRRGHTQPRKPR